MPPLVSDNQQTTSPTYIEYPQPLLRAAVYVRTCRYRQPRFLQQHMMLHGGVDRKVKTYLFHTYNHQALYLGFASRATDSAPGATKAGFVRLIPPLLVAFPTASPTAACRPCARNALHAAGLDISSTTSTKKSNIGRTLGSGRAEEVRLFAELASQLGTRAAQSSRRLLSSVGRVESAAGATP